MEELKTSELVKDDKNFNKGTDFGAALMHQSLHQFGTGRSILIDKNNKIIAGNKTVEYSEGVGIKDVIIVESDGTKIIAVKRTDIDLDTPKGREMALADNATSKANIMLDLDLIEKEMGRETEVKWLVPNPDDTDLDSFFQGGGAGAAKEGVQKIILEFSDDDYDRVIGALSKLEGTKEEIILKLLGF